MSNGVIEPEKIPLIGFFRIYEVLEVFHPNGSLTDFQCRNPEIQAYGRKIYGLNPNRGKGKLYV